MRYTLLFVLLCLTLNATAFQIDIQVIDINNKANLENVKITVTNPGGNILNTSLTDSDGLVSLLVNETHTDYNYTYSKLGYHAETNIVNNLTTIIYESLYPISDDGIISINFGDRLFNEDRQFCIYYKSNNRLDGCYKLNDTVTLLVNQEYIIIPKTTITDSLTSFENIKNNFSNNAFLIIMAIIIVILIISLTAHFWKRGFKLPKIRVPKISRSRKRDKW